LQALLALAILAGVLTIMAATYQSSLRTINLLIDDQPRVVKTNQRTVDGVLRDAAITFYPEDHIQPALDTQLAANDTIRITRARPVSLHVDGRTLAVRTHATHLFDLFTELGVSVGPNDALTIDGASAVPGSMLVGAPGAPHAIAIQRATPLTVVFDDNSSRTLFTTRATIGQALSEAGIDIFLADHVTPPMDTRITPGVAVYVERSKPISVRVDGQTLHTRTHQDRVGDVLAEIGLMLNGQDYSVPALDAPVEAGVEVRVVRVTEDFFIEQESIPFETQILPNANMEIDTQQLVQDGESGVLQKRIRIRYEDGQEVARVIEGQTIARAPRPKIINYGTQIVIRTIQTEQGPREYWRHFRALATSYSAATAGTPRSAPNYGRTALGLQMRKGIVAVDPDIIPYRSEIFVPNYGVGYAGDTGGAIIGKHIDLGYDDHNLIIWYRWVEVYLLTPAPPADQIEYILPNWPIER
jgi:uncharacterized protein YabE (DUF348 family)